MNHHTLTETVRNGHTIVRPSCRHERHHGNCADCQRAAQRRQLLHLIASDEAARRWVAAHPLRPL